MEQDFNKEHWEQKKCPQYDCRKKQCECGLEKVFLSAALGDDSKDSPIAPKNGEYCNAIVVYEANGHVYIYSKEGIPTLVESEGTNVEEIIEQLEGRLDQEVLDRQAADNVLQGEIDDIKNSPDVVDIVATYAALQAYDTSKLGDNDIVRVLQDEQHDGQSTYYRWNKQSSTWTYIGAVGDYYTKGQVDTLLSDKQDELTAGANISIAQVDNDLVISATDTTYTAGTNISISSSNVISATDTTYSNFTGTDGQTAGTAGLVPAPATTDADKFLKSDGTWATAGGGGGDTVYSTKTTSNASDGGAVFIGPLNASQTPLVDPTTVDNHYRYFWAMPFDTAGQDNFGIPGSETINIGGKQNGSSHNITIGYRTGALSGDSNIVLGFQAEARGYSYNVIIGESAISSAGSAVVIGRAAEAAANGTVALGAYSRPTRAGEVNIGTSQSSYGYNNTNYRVLGGVHDGQSAHDAATVAQGNTLGSAAPTTSTVGVVGQLYTDTTTGKLYHCTAIDTSVTPNTYTWEEIGAGGGGPTVVQTTGSSTTDVMSQNATTGLVFADPATKFKVQIGANASTSNTTGVAIGSNVVSSAGNSAIAIGVGLASAHGAISIGHHGSNNAGAKYKGSIALGAYAYTSEVGEMNIGATDTTYGYNSTNYRLLSGVHDPVNAHDAATKGYVDAHAGGGAVTLLTSADYNWDSSGQGGDPDAIAGWLLDDGWYITDGNTNVYLNSDNGDTTGINTLIQVSNGGMSISAIDSGIIVFNEVNTADGTISGGYIYPDGTMGPYEFYMSDWGDFIKQTPQTNSVAPDVSTEGTLGQLYTDTDTMHTYQCTAIDDTDPDNIEYTWTQRW